MNPDDLSTPGLISLTQIWRLVFPSGFALDRETQQVVETPTINRSTISDAVGIGVSEIMEGGGSVLEGLAKFPVKVRVLDTRKVLRRGACDLRPLSLLEVLAHQA